MTLPSERTNAVLRTEDFLRRLASPYNPGGLKKIPIAVRVEARRLLRHYPLALDLLHAEHAFDPETAGAHLNKETD